MFKDSKYSKNDYNDLNVLAKEIFYATPEQLTKIKKNLISKFTRTSNLFNGAIKKAGF